MGVFYKLLRSLFLIFLLLNIVPIILNFFSIDIAAYFIFLIWLTALLLFYSFLPAEKNLAFYRDPELAV